MVLPLQLSPASLLLRSSCVPFISRRRNRTATQLFGGLVVPTIRELRILSGVASPALSCFSSSAVFLCTFYFKKKKQNCNSILGGLVVPTFEELRILSGVASPASPASLLLWSPSSVPFIS